MADARRLHSSEAEQSVIGGLLLDPSQIPDAAALLKPDDFTGDLERKVFGALVEMSAAGHGVDGVTVAEFLEDRGQLDNGDMSAIFVAARDTFSAANAMAYAGIVRDRARRRALVSLGGQIQRWAVEDGDAEQTLLRLKRSLDALDGGPDAGGLVPLRELLSGCADAIDRRYYGVAPQGMPTGIPDLDALLHGLQPGKLYVVSGRPGMGKSVLGLQFAAVSAAREGKSAAFFTAEMPSSEQVERLISSVGRIDLDALQTGALEADDWPRMTAAFATLSSARLWFDETPTPRLADIVSKARRLHRREGPLGLVVVDHAGLVEGAGETREQRQADVGRSLKALAKELSCPVVALLQLNRRIEERADKRPLLSDGRDSGEWEQSADVFAGLYRAEVYDPESLDKGCAELLIRKNRGGKLGVVPLAFLGQYQRFEPLAGGLPSWSASTVVPMRKRGIDL
ncbi:MAG: replicative DNA helicase [Candidatus Competibacteraceae bacterium]|jgi:replicative DNA helicase|nr:replicative DNA helicase [Candidatus Competibacteraceae bacterium]